MPSLTALAASRSGRYTLAAGGAVFLALLWLVAHQTSYKPDFLTSALSYSQGWQIQAASSGDPEALDPLNVDPTEVEPMPAADAQWSKDKWFFEYDLPPEHYRMPAFNMPKLSRFGPRNWRGPGHNAFAMCFLSHNGSLHDPYFMGTQQIVYRLLWDQRSKSEKYPVVVFVPPYVPEEQRLLLSSAGAIVREVEQLEFEPNHRIVGVVAGRLKDVFTKLQMWDQLDFNKLAFLDADANPVVNIDSIFDEAPISKCKPELIGPMYADLAEDICEYTFGAYKEFTGMLNAGVMIIKPNHAMHELLYREYKANEHFDNGFVEQALLTYVFNDSSAFPPTFIEQKWNANPDIRDKGEEINIVHAKIWALFATPGHWSERIFVDTWDDMLRLYNSTEFETMRAEDDKKSAPYERRALLDSRETVVLS